MKAKPGHIIDEHGAERKVLGTLPLTEDGCVAGQHCYVWVLPEVGHVWRRYIDPFFTHDGPCYSTPEAAKAAQEANP